MRLIDWRAGPVAAMDCGLGWLVDTKTSEEKNAVELKHHTSIVEITHYLFGDLDSIEAARVRAHCDECTQCDGIRRLMARGRREKGWFVAEEPLWLGECYSDETLGKYGEKDSDLTPAERDLVTQHLETCQGCQERLECLSIIEPLGKSC